MTNGYERIARRSLAVTAIALMAATVRSGGIAGAADLLQETGESAAAASSSGGYVLAAYALTGALLLGYGLSLWWRLHTARATLEAWESHDPPHEDGRA